MKKVEELKNKLESLAERDFYLEMRSNWSNEDFKLSREIAKEIKEVIEELKNEGIIATYKLGYDIEYKEAK